ncbi:scavenger mRNA decapping enzyme [Trichoderma citrinoviride]|uniref:Scavenger mRNA decapping enzyme n=1 Tax=Trichoderma citrinoviride TaxID=58853 RepID=A0A2T4BNA1_9HYPO|nr:scavenger mRNA decapping enzyme [Trichoderma citrinoviride]PTB70804.1 scavenger mRNA decapping enzyme [Trichoderma citrinoviride]
MADLKARAEAAVPKFKLLKVLNQDQAGRRIALHGTIDNVPAVMVVERAPIPSSEAYLAALPSSLARIRNLGANDIYAWSMARTGSVDNGHDNGVDFFADLKINLIYPCTEAHVKKYSKQGVRFVTETPEIYRNHIRPFMQLKREQGRLNWVYNIIEGRTEVEDVIFRTKLGEAGDEGFLLLPDLNWDRKTLEALHLLALVERRDIWSLRDLKKKHIPWLQHIKAKVVGATTETYPGIEENQLKLYVHYQPTYYHFHIHIVHVALEAGATQAVGKAVGLDSIIETLKVMGGDDEAGMDALSMSYTLGEASELWTDIYEPLLKTSHGTASG